jgi:protein O-mannosyl-transferase
MTVGPGDPHGENRKKMESASAPIQNRPESMSAPKSPEHLAGLNGKRAVPGVCVLLMIAVLLAFGRTLRHDFVNYDDDLYFYANPQVQHGLTWGGVAWAFQSTYAANWHPLTWLSLMLDAELFGPGPLGPHLTNVILHAVNTVLLFLLLRRLTGAHWRSALVAALFGLHPLHVESVAWVSERKDVLSGLFFMLTLWAYAQYVSCARGQEPGERRTSNIEHRTPNAEREESRLAASKRSEDGIMHHAPRYYLLCLFLFALGLMSKPMLVTLPFVLLLLDYWPLERFAIYDTDSCRVLAIHRSLRFTMRRLAWEKVPFFALSAASCVVTFVAQGKAVQPLAHISLEIRAVNASVSYVRYLYKMFWPVNLATPYPHHGYWTWGVFGLSAALILAAVMFAIQLRRKFPFLITGWFWYLGMLVPVIGLVQVGTQAMADRYTYLPLVGVFILLVWGMGAMFERRRLPTPAIGGLALLVLAVCTARMLDQQQYWKNSGTLFRHTVAVTKNNQIAYNNLGEYYFGQGRLDEAIDNYRKAIQIRPGYDDALNNLGAALAIKGELDEAIARIRESIHYRPDKADAYYNLGNVFVMQHKLDEAAGAYTDALRFKPDYPEAHNNLANVLLTQGHPEAAIQHYREALRLNPNHEGAKRQLRSLGVSIP